MTKKLTAVLLAVLVLLSFAACTTPQQAETKPEAAAQQPAAEQPATEAKPEEPAAPAELRQITIGIPHPFEAGDATPHHVAVAMGYFAEEGLAPVFETAYAANSTKLLASGEFDIAYLAPTIVMAGVDAGMPIVDVMNVRSINIFGLAVRADSGITSIKEMEGKTLGYLQETDKCAYEPIFAAAGVDSSKVEQVLVGQSRSAMLEDGTIDIAFTWVTEAALWNKAFGVTYFGGEEAGVLTESNGWCANYEQIEKDKELLAACCRAILKARLFCQLNPDAAVDIMLQDVPSLAENRAGVYDLTKADAEIGDIASVGNEYGRHNAERWENNANIQKQYGFVSADFDVTKAYNDDLFDLYKDWDYAGAKADAENWTGVACRRDTTYVSGN